MVQHEFYTSLINAQEDPQDGVAATQELYGSKLVKYISKNFA